MGSTLTHPYITTDYSESLLEFITPTVNSAEQVITWLELLHCYSYQHIGNEILWNYSMPCRLTTQKDIPIAQYGASNAGQMRHIYRRGLAYRYGKNMQTIAGTHVNLSFPTTLWPILQTLEHNNHSLTDFITAKYLNLIRNYCRCNWFIFYLFGASPAVSKSFMANAPDYVKSLGNNTYYGPHATTLRMSNIGYQNNAQSKLVITYNHLTDYLEGLRYATSTPEPPISSIWRT